MPSARSCRLMPASSSTSASAARPCCGRRRATAASTARTVRSSARRFSCSEAAQATAPDCRCPAGSKSALANNSMIRKPTLVPGSSWPTAGIDHRQLTGSLKAAPMPDWWGLQAPQSADGLVRNELLERVQGRASRRSCSPRRRRGAASRSRAGSARAGATRAISSHLERRHRTRREVERGLRCR